MEKRRVPPFQIALFERLCYGAQLKIFTESYRSGVPSKLVAPYYNVEVWGTIYGKDLSARKRKWRRSSETW